MPSAHLQAHCFCDVISRCSVVSDWLKTTRCEFQQPVSFVAGRCKLQSLQPPCWRSLMRRRIWIFCWWIFIAEYSYDVSSYTKLIRSEAEQHPTEYKHTQLSRPKPLCINLLLLDALYCFFAARLLQPSEAAQCGSCCRAAAVCHIYVLCQNGKTYGHSCYGMRIGNCTQVFKCF